MAADLTTASEKLLKDLNSLKPRSRDSYTCQITLINNCPSDWDVTILAAGVKFFYRDNTDYTDGPRNIDLRTGGSATFVSNSSEECTAQFFLAMTVQAGSEPPQNMTYQNGVPQDQCLLHESVILGPKSSVSESAHKAKKSIVDFLELRRSN
ncbi:MAG TPA: hypothetical protein VMI06_05155 [Terriglobia bacterium]|nr:hypothetical protein [Terriglobia bacterium]